LIADNTSNSIFISGPKENIDKVDKIISALDVRGKQVYLATVIGQLTLSDDTETGITYLQKFAEIDTGIYDGGVASSLVAGAPATDPRLLVDTDDFFDVAGSGLNVYGTIVGSLDAFVAAISRTSRFKTIGRPNLFTANNRPATIASGRREPVPTSTVSNLVSGDSTAVNASIGFEDVELSIEIVPLINANREVTLDIYQRNDTVQERIEIAGSQVPVIATQELRTTVTVPDRSTIVLGGLISETESYNESGIPVLKDIPLLGGLFKSTNDETQRSELIILIQPSVIETEADLYYANFLEQRRNAVSDDARQLMRGENPEVRRAIPVDPAYLTPPAPADAQRPVTSKSMVTP
jgi:type II secretory pathway component GspD/PulD (secretin)